MADRDRQHIDMRAGLGVTWARTSRVLFAKYRGILEWHGILGRRKRSAVHFGVCGKAPCPETRGTGNLKPYNKR